MPTPDYYPDGIAKRQSNVQYTLTLSPRELELIINAVEFARSELDRESKDLHQMFRCTLGAVEYGRLLDDIKEG